jgi:AcrR family transcriptional regulator
MPTTTKVKSSRLSAEERRRAIVVVAREEFALRGLHGTSTDRIAERAGVSQPYLFRLFGTKKDLFIACVEAGFGHVLGLFREAAGGVSREEALDAMGRSYGQLLRDRTELLAQLHAYAACEDEEIRAAVRRGYADLYRFVASASEADEEELRHFFAFGMLMNVVAAMDLTALDEGWAKDIVKGCLP